MQALLLIAGLSGAGNSLAADSRGNYAVWGLGQASCNQFVQAYEKKATRAFSLYLSGYLTAVNTLVEGVHQATGKNSAADNLEHLHQYCSAHRMDSFERAIQHLVDEQAAPPAAGAPQAPPTWGRPPPAS